MSEPLKARLTAGIAELGLTITEHQTEQLLTYLQEFHKWNRAYNLSAVRDIDAPPDVVWERIGAFGEYAEMVPRISESEIYLRRGADVRVRMVLRVLGFRYEYFIQHDFRPDQGFITWTRDYSKLSDLDESVGYWAVTPHPSESGRSRLFYSIEMKTRGWMPGFLRRMIARQGLEEATGWVKQESEARSRGEGGSGRDSE